ncbi:GntR family transcriptional regulator [Marinovum sp.]|uniref:GntR family transcriptional regulator n=1 Tax=Marinovum sp. TaxID=2024839 RepID=UPI002B2697AF|nr:GntR family transcriptional regulator [Marinovum sp.]
MNIFEPAVNAPEGSATQQAYRRLRSMIVTGALRPGEKLKIDGLRKVLDTGASPIREALSLLTSDNLVERIDQRGFRAAEVSAENFSEILQLRCVLEDLALRESIANYSQDWEEAAVLAHHRMQRAQADKAESFEDLHKAFHMALLSNARSPILLKFCSQLYDLNIRYRYLAGSALAYQRRDVREEHAGILAAALAQDADTASARLLDHYKLTGAFLSGLLGDGTLG